MSNLKFSHTQKNLNELADKILKRTIELGATSAQLEINEAIETSIEVLNNNIENFETSYDSAISLNIFVGHKRGNIAISQVPPQDLDTIIQQGIDIAKYTEEDPYNGIAEKNLLCTSFTENLELYNPIEISNQKLIGIAKDLESIALSLDSRISASDGAGLSIGKYNFVIANTNGLNLGYQTTRYNNSLALISNTNDGMQTDYWYSSARDFEGLEKNPDLARNAVNRILRRLNKGTITAGNYPVIFEPKLAKSLISNFLGAISGGSLYRNLSFLNNSLNTQVFPDWVNIDDDPFIIKGQSSCYFDNEGVSVNKRRLVDNGVVNGYILSCYSARKLGLVTTGNSGGNHNIIVHPNFTGSASELVKTMGHGLVIIETIGHGVNMVTGDYSVGASALYVENGEIQFFVDNLTISGNLKDIFKGITYIGNDYNNSSILCGSMLVDQIYVSL